MAPIVVVVAVIGVFVLGGRTFNDPLGPIGAGPSGVPSTAVGSSHPSPVPSPSAAPSLGMMCSTGGQGCPLDAGTYSTAPSRVPFHLVLGSGWSGSAFESSGLVVKQKDAATFTWIYWLVDPGGISRDGFMVGFQSSSQQAENYVANFLPGLTAGPAMDTTIGGLPAREIDVVSTTENDSVLLPSGSGDMALGVGFHATTKANNQLIRTRSFCRPFFQQ